MKQNFKRFLSIVLTCVMLFGMLPVSAFAAEADETTPVVETPIVVETTVPETTVPETTVPETTVPETTVPETTVPETTVPETTVPETTVPETTVPETTVPETTVPEETVPEVTVAEDPVQDLYDTLMAFETYEALGDYMDAMTEEQYALMDQFSDEQNNALFAKIDQLLGNDDVAVYKPGGNGPTTPTTPTTPDDGDHTFTHLDVRIQNIPLTLTKKVINMVTGAVVDTDETTITANLTKVEYAIINGVTYNNFTKMDDREWRQSNVTINLSALTDSSTAVLVVDLVDANGKTYDNVRLTYNRAGIQYAMEHCDGYKNGQYDGIDFDPSESGSYITLVEFDDYVIPVMKIWDDANNQDGKRPASVTINLYADGELNDSATLNANNNWQYIFEDKPSEDGNGNTITYTIDEASVPDGYTKTSVGNNGTHLTVTNSYTPETTKVEGSKTWDDNNNQDGIRPTSITVNLLADGKETGKSVTVTAEDGWAWSFENLPKYAAGKAIAYSVSEVKVDGYTTTVSGMDITNTHIPEKTSVSGEKTWDDANNQDGIRPVSITVNLMADGEKVKSQTVSAGADGKWTYTFTDVDKYADGKEIIYTVSEEAVTGYTAKVSGMNITNTHTPEKTSVKVTKVWDDENNLAGFRTDSVTVQLKANGAAQGDAVVLNAGNNWTNTWSNLDKFAGGEIITYTVEEINVPSYYTAAVSGDSANGFTITNTHTPERINLSVEKKWDDEDNRDGIRPDSIIVNLLANGTEVATAEVTADNDWKHTFEGFVKYANGQEIEYAVEEADSGSYTATYEGLTITNTYTPERTQISVSKIWDDNNNQDGIRPASITVQLKANGTAQGAAVALNEGNNWSHTFTNLYQYENGKEIAYTVEEAGVPKGYTSVTSGDETDGYTITNTHAPEKISVSVKKVWDDADNQDGIRPTSITVQLKANGTAQGAAVELNEGNNWSHTFTELDKFANGQEIAYIVEEAGVPEDYTSVTTGNKTDGYTITNTHAPEKISVSVKKVWDDADNQDGIRPTSITVQLKANGTEQGAAVELNEDNNWSHTFTELDKFANGQEVAYAVEEAGVPKGYTTETTGNKTDGYIITNTHAPEQIKVSVTKNWDDADNQDGVRPAFITYRLWNGEEEVASKAVTAENNWAWTFENLDKFEAGKEIAYTVTEDAVADYDVPVITGDMVDGFVVTNTHNPELIDIPVAKVWIDADDQDGLRTESITVVLLNDVSGNPDFAGKSLVLNDANEWQGVFEDLPKYRDGGIEIDYTVDEIKINGYKVDITGDQAEGYTITNTHIPETTAVEGTKTWVDDEDRDGLRPESITINLVADDKIIETIEVTEKDGWVWSFEELPVYRDHGTEIVYKITEEAVDGYTTVIEGFNVTNTHKIATTEVKGAKTWNDDNDRDGLRPEAITINLVADGEIIETIEVTEAEGWAWSFEQLPVYRDQGTEIVYTVAEAAVEGYETVIEGFDITNTHEIATTEVKGAKTWDDANNQDGKRPASITINLVADGEIIETIEVTEAEGWAWSFTELPKYKDHGVEIVYAITENAVEGYATTYDGYNVINSYTPQETSVTVTKAWADSNNAEGIRPGSVTIRLMANGVFTGLTLELDAQSKWVGSFTGLPKYFEGELVEYTVDEVAVKGYTTVIKGNMEEGFTVTNTHVYIPQTGDDRTPMMWITMMAVSAMMIALASIDSKKRRNATK